MAASDTTQPPSWGIEAYTVSRLARYLKELLESDLSLSNIWIEAEVTNLSRSSAGHTYFSLKDDTAQVRCVMFRRAYSGAALDNGQQVLAHGHISFYEGRGDLQFYVDFVQPAGVGVWAAQFERLKAQLEAEGLFEPSRKRPLPRFPRRIGVVTSPAGAVFHDVCHVIGRRWPLAEIVLAPTPVQGPEAPGGIIGGLQQLNEEPDVEVVILARGGGSMEEMWPFNEEAVARAVYASRAPVVCGVGHETDYTIADLVADVRAPTPSAAAEMAVPDRADIALRLGTMAMTLHGWTAGMVNQRRAALDQSLGGLRRSLPDLRQLRERSLRLAGSIAALSAQALAWRRERVGGHLRHLASLDPRQTLARGYAVVQKRDGGRVVTSVGEVKARERLDVFVKDGRFPAEVSRQYGF
ncbi:MAG: exodeoxyribonuclease VII large subunit [Chloroflexi bacterium]|nr:exodeoxyribonuclease VII large subunit [Chloroflexota bacterium]